MNGMLGGVKRRSLSCCVGMGGARVGMEREARGGEWKTVSRLESLSWETEIY